MKIRFFVVSFLVFSVVFSLTYSGEPIQKIDHVSLFTDLLLFGIFLASATCALFLILKILQLRSATHIRKGNCFDIARRRLRIVNCIGPPTQTLNFLGGMNSFFLAGYLVVSFSGPKKATNSFQEYPENTRIAKVLASDLSGKKILVRLYDLHHQNYQRIWLKSRGCFRAGFAWISRYGVRCEGRGDPHFLFTSISKKNVRKYLRAFFETHKGMGRGWIYAVATGDASELGHNVRQVFREFGLMHMCAVSGFHLALVLGFCRFFEWTVKRVLGLGRLIFFKTARCGSLKIFDLLRSRTVNFPRFDGWLCFSGLCTLIWLIFVDFKVSALRAVLCFIFIRFMGLQITNRQDLARIFTVFIVLVPSQVFALGSILSWVSYLLVICTLGSKDKERLGASREFFKPGIVIDWQRLLRQILSTVSLQVSLTLVSFILIREMSLLAFVGNVLVLPVVSAAFMILVCMRVLGFSDLFGVGCEWAVSVLETFRDICERGLWWLDLSAILFLDDLNPYVCFVVTLMAFWLVYRTFVRQTRS